MIKFNGNINSLSEALPQKRCCLKEELLRELVLHVRYIKSKSYGFQKSKYMITRSWGHCFYFCLSDSRNWSCAWLRIKYKTQLLPYKDRIIFSISGWLQIKFSEKLRDRSCFYLWKSECYLFARTTLSFTKLWAWIIKHFDFHTVNNYSMIIRRAKRGY